MSDVAKTSTATNNRKKFWISVIVAASAVVSATGYLIPDVVEVPVKAILEAVKHLLQSE